VRQEVRVDPDRALADDSVRALELGRGMAGDDRRDDSRERDDEA
jgi:hypothetical protein